MLTSKRSLRARCARAQAPVAEPPVFEALPPRLLLAIATWDGGPTGEGTDWSVAANWAGDALPTPADDVHLVATGSNPTITLGAPVSINSLTSARSLTMQLSSTLTLAAASSFNPGTTFTMAAGSLAGAGTLTVDGAMNWGGGSMAGPGSTVIGPGGTLSIGAVTATRILARTLEVDGGATWSAGELRFSAGTIRNDGTFVLTGTAADVNLGGANAIVNNGTFTKTGAGTLNLDAIAFTNAGTLDVQQGTLELDVMSHVFTGPVTVAGTLRLLGGTVAASGTWSGAGTVQLSSGSLAVATALTVAAGTFSHVGGTISGAGVLTITGAATWSGGLMIGSGTTRVAAGATMALTSLTATRTLSRTLEIDGAATWSGGELRFGGGAIVNDGVFTADAAGNDINLGGSNAFLNNGTFVKSTPSTVTFDAVTFTNAGVLTISEGTLEFDGLGHVFTGPVNLDSGTSRLRILGGMPSASGDWLGFGTVEIAGGTLTANASLNIGTLFVVLSSGGITGTGAVRLGGIVRWTGGFMSGSGTTTIHEGDTLELLAVTGARTLSRTLVTHGFTSWEAGDWRLSGGSIVNDGEFVVSGGNDINLGGANTFVNNGVLRKAGPGSMSLDAMAVTNNATLRVSEGVLAFESLPHALGGTVTFEGGTLRVVGGNVSLSGVWSGTGLAELTGGTMTCATTLDVSVPVTFSGGTLSGAGVATFSAALAWSGGLMGGPGRTIVGPTGSLTLGPNVGARTLARVLQLDGTAVWNAGDWRYSGGTLDNRGELTVDGGVTLINLGGSNAITNSGILTRTGAGSTSTFGGLTLTNTQEGSLNVVEGTLSLQTQGSPAVNAGAVHLGAGALLNVLGAFTQTATGSMETEIAGPANYGRVTASGVASLGGTLAAALVDGYAPALFARFDVVTGPTVNGAFASVSLPAPAGATRKWITVYQPNRVQLVYTSTADWNSDGIVNSTDVSDFINDWFADQLKGGLITDFNGDGVSNSTDVSDFINLWFADQSV